MIIGPMTQISQPISSVSAAPVAGAVRLTDFGVMRAQGEEAAKFLHSQLTQDLALQTLQPHSVIMYESLGNLFIALPILVQVLGTILSNTAVANLVLPPEER